MIPCPSHLLEDLHSQLEDGLNGLTNYSIAQKTEARVVKPRVSRTKGHLSKRTAFVREIVKEVSGYVAADSVDRWEKLDEDELMLITAFGRLAPYERRVIELLRNSKDKRARKLAKKRVRLPLLRTRFTQTLIDLQLGTFGRAKAKVDELQRVIAESRRAAH
jgi:large subunit ribosomal protein L36e